MLEIKDLFGEGTFYERKETKDQTAQIILKHVNNTFIDTDGIAKCKKCKTAKMYHEIYILKDGNAIDKWLPVICKCEFEEMEARRKEETEAAGWKFEPRKYIDNAIQQSFTCPF